MKVCQANIAKAVIQLLDEAVNIITERFAQVLDKYKGDTPCAFQYLSCVMVCYGLAKA